MPIFLKHALSRAARAFCCGDSEPGRGSVVTEATHSLRISRPITPSPPPSSHSRPGEPSPLERNPINKSEPGTVLGYNPQPPNTRAARRSLYKRRSYRTANQDHRASTRSADNYDPVVVNAHAIRAVVVTKASIICRNLKSVGSKVKRSNGILARRIQWLRSSSSGRHENMSATETEYHFNFKVDVHPSLLPKKAQAPCLPPLRPLSALKADQMFAHAQAVAEDALDPNELVEVYSLPSSRNATPCTEEDPETFDDLLDLFPTVPFSAPVKYFRHPIYNILEEVRELLNMPIMATSSDVLAKAVHFITLSQETPIRKSTEALLSQVDVAILRDHANTDVEVQVLLDEYTAYISLTNTFLRAQCVNPDYRLVVEAIDGPKSFTHWVSDYPKWKKTELKRRNAFRALKST